MAVGLSGCTNRESTEMSPETTSSIPSDKPACTTVSTDFPLPDINKPEVMGESKAVDITYKIEESYQQSIKISPGNFSGVPADSSPYDYRLEISLSDTYSENSTIYVTLKAIVSYTVRENIENSTNSQKSYDKPVNVATYTVNNQLIRRESGVGELTGSIVCW